MARIHLCIITITVAAIMRKWIPKCLKLSQRDQGYNTPYTCTASASNPLGAKEGMKHIFTFYVIPPDWHGTGNHEVVLWSCFVYLRNTYILVIIRIASFVLKISHKLNNPLRYDENLLVSNRNPSQWNTSNVPSSLYVLDTIWSIKHKYWRYAIYATQCTKVCFLLCCDLISTI